MPFWISSMIASGGSLRGLSEVMTTMSDRRAGNRAHQRPLAAVAVAAAAEHGDDAARLQVANRLEQLAQRVVGMGVVDDHREAGDRAPHPLHAPRDAADRSDAPRRGVEGQAQRQRSAERREHVVDVETAEQRARDLDVAAAGCARVKRAPSRVRTAGRRRERRQPSRNAVGEHPAARCALQQSGARSSSALITATPSLRR